MEKSKSIRRLSTFSAGMFPSLIQLAFLGGYLGLAMAVADRGFARFSGAARVLTVVICYALAVASTIVVVGIISHWRHRRRFLQIFKFRVSQAMLNRLKRQSREISLEGESRVATTFFSDMTDFTSTAERLTPAELVCLFDAYLTPMTKVILEHDGYLDKIEGDAIIAQWGVPLEQENHAVLACHAALDQQRRLEEIRPVFMERFGHDLIVRMGLNSGEVTAGVLGPAGHVDYTVLGESVHRAARFELLNKDYATSIIIGQGTYDLACGHIEARLLDKITIGDGVAPVLVYELLGRAGELSSDRRRVVELYEKALKIHWYRQFDKAVELLNEGLAIDLADAPSIALKRRMDGYKRTPPPRTWQGERLGWHGD